MTLTVELPDNLTRCENPTREALEAVALEAYRTGSMSHSEAAVFLNMGRFDFEGLLKKKNIMEGAYDVDDLLSDIRTTDQLRAAGKLRG